MSDHESKQNNPRISSQITISSVFPVTSKSLRSPLSAAPHLPPWPGVPQQPKRSQRPCSLHRSQATLRGTGSSFASPRDTATTPWKPCQHSEAPQATGIFISRFLSCLTQISFRVFAPRDLILCVNNEQLLVLVSFVSNFISVCLLPTSLPESPPLSCREYPRCSWQQGEEQWRTGRVERQELQHRSAATSGDG